MTHFWIRHEARTTERRAPLTPADAGALMADGFQVTVESSPQRVFGDDEYAAVGATIAPTASWPQAPSDAYILGLKELPESDEPLAHRHIFFGHAYKGQDGARELLDRFAAGGGMLLDIEYLTDAQGRRVVAFGYWAGFVGAALGVLALRGRLHTPLIPMSAGPTAPDTVAPGAAASGASAGSPPAADLTTQLKPRDGDAPLRALVIGALGRSGRGAVDALAHAGVTTTKWDIAETESVDKAALLDHDLLVNCVVSTTTAPPFVTDTDLDGARRLTMIADVTCDVTSEHNMLPVNTSITSWDDPVRELRDQPRAAVIAVDNLPSLVPQAASVAFSRDLLPALRTIDTGDIVWDNARAAYDAASS